MPETEAQKRSWAETLKVYTRPRVVGMVFLGFSAGLPFLLVFSTLSAWLRDEGVSRTTIGFFSWVGITYSIKFFWAPVIDRLNLPYPIQTLGKRRSWMLLAQLTIAFGLVGMAFSDPHQQLQTIALFALLVAFGSATQDITIDAYRIEAVEKILQGAMAATYVFGYRVALLMAGAGAFYIAEAQSWQFAYLVMAGLMGIGIVTTFIIREPIRTKDESSLSVEQALEKNIGIESRRDIGSRFVAWFMGAVVAPFVEFFKRNGWVALTILLLIGVYRLSDISMGVMANPFYLDMGFSKTDIANISKVFGFFMTILGAGLGGIMVVRYGILKPLLIGAFLVPLTNVLFIWLAVTGSELFTLGVVISADNLSGGIASSVFIAYLSSLTNTSYTATQYALFSSLMTLPGKIIGGYAGWVVDSYGYVSFFFYSGLLGIPAIALAIYFLRREIAENRISNEVTIRT